LDEETVEYYKQVIAENEDVMLNHKNMVFRIISAFIKAGVKLQAEVYPKLKNKQLYLPEFQGEGHCLSVE